MSVRGFKRLHMGHASAVLDEVFDEVDSQFDKWGEQNHPNQLTEEHWIYEWRADNCKSLNDEAVTNGSLDWTGVLLEEVYEALAESDEEKLRAELVQVAAVAVSWIQSIDRR